MYIKISISPNGVQMKQSDINFNLNFIIVQGILNLNIIVFTFLSSPLSFCLNSELNIFYYFKFILLQER